MRGLGVLRGGGLAAALAAGSLAVGLASGEPRWSDADDARGGWRQWQICAVGIVLHVNSLTAPPSSALQGVVGLLMMRACG